MKKFLLLLIATVCSMSVFAADMKQCKNCGKWFEGNPTIGYDYCRRNVCQKIRDKEESAQVQSKIQADRNYFKSASNKLQLLKTLGENLTKAQKENLPVNEQLNIIADVYKKFNSPYVWHQIIYYASIDVVKACWPVADNEDIMRKSSAAEANIRPRGLFADDMVITIEKNLHAADRLPLNKFEFEPYKQSNKQLGCAFALGRHQKTGETRYVEKLNANSIQYLIWAAEAGRTDVLEWFFKQMGGVDVTTLCSLTSAYAKQVKTYDQQRAKIELSIKNLEKQKDNAADKFQEKEIAKKISAAKAKMAKIPSKLNGYENVIKTVIKNTDAKVFDEFISIVEDYFKSRDAEQQYKNTALDFMKYNAKGKKAVKNYESIGSFIWKSGLPNPKKVGVLCGAKEGTWVAAPGFVMQKDGSAKWQAGLKHPKYKNIVSTEKIFYWLPEKDYDWKYADSLEAADPAAIMLERLNQKNKY